MPGDERVTVPLDVFAPEALREYLEEQKKLLVPGRDYAPTPFSDWNDVCLGPGGGRGLAMGWYVIVAGNPGFGKSVLALGMAISAMRAGVSVGFISLEMTPIELATRIYAIASGKSARKITRGPAFDEQETKQALKDVYALSQKWGARFFVNHDLGDELFEIADIVREMDQWRTSRGVRYFIVDYLQLCRASDEREMIRQVQAISSALRRYARQHEVVILALSQFNRTTAREYKQKPTIQGLFGGWIEQDAHQVFMLDHSRWESTDDGAELYGILGKNRHGPKNVDIPLALSYKNLRFRVREPDELPSRTIGG